MPWWMWILVWLAVAAVAGSAIGHGMSQAETNDWIRRGRPERRAAARRVPEQTTD